MMSARASFTRPHATRSLTEPKGFIISSLAYRSIFGKPCTSAPEAQWLPMAMRTGLISRIDEVAVAQALHPDIRLKWPNDLLIDGRKAGGMLTEARIDADALVHAGDRIEILEAVGGG